MMGIGFPELMIILVIIMIIFGAGKLPEIGNAFGKSIKNFKSSMKEADEEAGENNAEIAPSPSPEENVVTDTGIEEAKTEPDSLKESTSSTEEQPLSK